MPLYIKLDFGKEGKIHAWVSRDEFRFTCLSEVDASTPKACLRELAAKIGKLENIPVKP
jgi:hypothetical protein